MTADAPPRLPAMAVAADEMSGDQPANCGTCTLCCKVKHVPDFPAKPRHEWCSHCDIGKGCQIYAVRPEPCREYQCMWLMSQGDEARFIMAAELRPDRCKAVIDPLNGGEGVVAFVDPGRPDAWKVGPLGQYLERVRAKGLRVVIAVGHKRTLLAGPPG